MSDPKRDPDEGPTAEELPDGSGPTDDGETSSGGDDDQFQG